MTPQHFEAIAEPKQETIQMHDERIAANVLDNTLSLMNGTEPQLATSHTVFENNPDIFSQKTELPDLKTQENGIPDNHDCTRCAVHVSACALLQAAKESSPFADRLSVVSQLSTLVEGFKDLPKDQVESLIKEGISVIKAKREGLKITSTSDTSNPIDSLTSQQSELVKEPKPIVEAVVQKPHIPDHILKMRQGIKPQEPAKVSEPITFFSHKEEAPVQTQNIVEPTNPPIIVNDVPTPEAPIIKMVEVARATPIPPEIPQSEIILETIRPPEPIRTVGEVFEAPQKPPVLKGIAEPTVPREIFEEKSNISTHPGEIYPIPREPNTLTQSTIRWEPIHVIPPQEERKSIEVFSESTDNNAAPKQVENRTTDETDEVDEPAETQEMENMIYVGDFKSHEPAANTSESTDNSETSFYQNEMIHADIPEDIQDENSAEINTYNVFTFQEGSVVFDETKKIPNDPSEEQPVQEILADIFVEDTSEESTEMIADTTTVFQQEMQVEKIDLELDSQNEIVENVVSTETISEIDLSPVESTVLFQEEMAEQTNLEVEILDENNSLIELELTEKETISVEVSEPTEVSGEQKNKDENFKEIKILNLEKEKTAEKSLNGIRKILTELPTVNKKEKQTRWAELIKSDPSLTEFSELLDTILLQLLLINNPEISDEIDFEKATSSSSLLYLYQLQDAAKEENNKQKYNINKNPLTYLELITFLWSYSNALMNSISTKPIVA